MNRKVERLSALIDANRISGEERRLTSLTGAHRTVVLIGAMLLWNFLCLAQSNVNSAAPITGSPALIGYQAASVTYTMLLQIGSGPGSFRVMTGSYWTDSAGGSIPFAGLRPRAPGDTHHRFTRVILGRVSFSLPMPPLAAGFVAITTLLLLGILPFAHAARRRASDEPQQPSNVCNTKSN